MKVSKSSAVVAAGVFDQYSSVEEPGFSRTHVPLCLAKYGHDTLVSRSQAKRILARFTRFSEVFLDFDGIDAIGQAFADEIFRVFRRQHPETNLVWVRANPRVKRMIERVTASAQTTEKNQ